MFLTLARLCGEWRWVSGNYKAQGASGGKYKAQIVIFHILAAVNRFYHISWKLESRWGKLESRWRNRKAIEESGKPLKKIEFCVRKMGLTIWPPIRSHNIQFVCFLYMCFSHFPYIRLRVPAYLGRRGSAQFSFFFLSFFV